MHKIALVKLTEKESRAVRTMFFLKKKNKNNRPLFFVQKFNSSSLLQPLIAKEKKLAEQDIKKHLGSATNKAAPRKLEANFNFSLRSTWECEGGKIKKQKHQVK